MKHSVIAHIVFIAATTFLVGICFTFKVGATKPEMVIPQGIQLISEQRTKAETQVSLLEGLLIDEEITKNEFGTAKTLYSEARGAFNGWIDRLSYDLRQEQELNASQDYQNTLREAAEKSDAFVQNVHLLYFGKERGGGGLGTFVSIFLKPLTDTGIAIWHEVKDYLATRHDQKEKVLAEVKAQLVSLKWRNFDELLMDIPPLGR